MSFAVHLDDTGIGRDEAEDAFEEERLAAARPADQNQRLPWCQRQVDGIEGADAVERPRDTLEPDLGLIAAGHCIVGMVRLWPSRTPDLGQREVIAFCRV